MTGLTDSFQRPISYLRVSITDRCNLRCRYCMPDKGISLFPRQDILSYEEIVSVAKVAAELGISKIRLTGGEPLVRAGVLGLVESLARIPGISDLSLTTNGVYLADNARGLKEAGLRRVNVSLDSLRRARFEAITRHDTLDHVLRGIDKAREEGLNPVKINMVVLRGLNDDEVVDFARRTISDGWNVRFIELMPLNNDGISSNHLVPVGEIWQRLESLGPLEPVHGEIGNGPAKYFRFPGAEGTVGFISPVSDHFCVSCNRLRLTADGKLRPCLMADDEIDLRPALRQEKDKKSLIEAFEQAIGCKPRGHRLVEGLVPQGRPMPQLGG